MDGEKLKMKKMKKVKMDQQTYFFCLHGKVLLLCEAGKVLLQLVPEVKGKKQKGRRKKKKKND